MGVLDFIFPKRCVQCKKVGSFLCENCFAYLSYDVKSLCLVCQRPIPDGLTHKVCLGKYKIDGSFSAIPYNKTAKKLIYNFKYKPYLSSLNQFLGDLLYEALLQNESFQRLLKSSKNWVFVPIPLHSSRLRIRGYNQSEILCDELSRRFNLKTYDLLKRVKETKTQVGLKLKDRKKNIKGAFEVSSKLSGMSAFLVDDIVTTGSTLLEAANVLKRGGIGKVIGITLARD